MSKKYIIVGGVAAGASTAARLRRNDEEGQIIVLEAGPFVSFSNCGLPYRLSGKIPKTENLILMTPERLGLQYALDVRVNNRVIRVDDKNKKVIIRNEITKEETEETYDYLILTPGTKAIIPSFVKKNAGMPVFQLKTVPHVEELLKHLKLKKPKHITVIGGGFIAVETAENLREKGLEVTLIEGTDQLLKSFDLEMSLYADAELIKHGVKIIKNNCVTEITNSEVVLDSGERITTDGVVMSIGVKPATDFLVGSGIKLEKDGYIKTDNNYKTTASNVYAAGDAIKVKNAITKKYHPILLAGPANKQGRLIADHISGKKIINKGYIWTSILKVFDISMATTGINEKILKTKKIKYDYAYAAPPGVVSIMPNKTFIKIKILFEKKTGLILGAQAIAEHGVDKRIDVIATAIKAKMTVQDLQDLELSYSPPFGTGKDVVNKIGYIANNILQGDFKQVKFTDVYKLLEEGKQIIDVREPEEYKMGHIDGVKNIPMSIIRDKLDEIDKTKPVYLHCRTGERSYNVTLMLQSKGFNAFNIAGSWLFLEAYEKSMKEFDKKRKNIIIGK